MLHLGDELEVLSLAFNVDVVDLKRREQLAHAVVVHADVLTQDHAEKRVEVVDDVCPQLLGHEEGLPSLRNLEIGLAQQYGVNPFLLVDQLAELLRLADLVIVEVQVFGQKLFRVKRLLIAYVGRIKPFENCLVNTLKTARRHFRRRYVKLRSIGTLLCFGLQILHAVILVIFTENRLLLAEVLNLLAKLTLKVPQISPAPDGSGPTEIIELTELRHNLVESFVLDEVSLR